MAETKDVETREHEAVRLENGEKRLSDRHSRGAQLHEFTETEGYLVGAEDGLAGYKLAKDGHTRLIPQPSDDPQDPLNWSWTTKHVVLFIVAASAFLPDYGSATGAITLLAQAACVLYAVDLLGSSIC